MTPPVWPIGDGTQWTDGTDTAGSHFIACGAGNACTIETGSGVTPVEPSWRHAVGGRRVLLRPGFQFDAADDTACGDHCTTLHPRTAVGLRDNGRTLIMVLVEGQAG